jgi:outer membrane protein assembly factor BamB
MRYTALVAIALGVLCAGCRAGADAPRPATIYAFDINTGEDAWSVKVPVAVVSAITEHDGVVFVWVTTHVRAVSRNCWRWTAKTAA